MTRKINFGAGPAALPESVLKRAQAELLDYNNLGLSVCEMSHRSKEFERIIASTESLLRELMRIPDDYAILFMHGGGTGQFAALPLNLAAAAASPADGSKRARAVYAITGGWSEKAAAEAKKYVDVELAFDLKGAFTHVPPLSEWRLNADAAYTFICSNETVHGVEYPAAFELPPHQNLVADISSHALSRPIDVTKYAAIIAGTQKNLGIGGLTIVIVRKSLLGRARTDTPGVLSYADTHKNKSLYNTPCCFAIYLTMLVLEWIKAEGGVEAMERNAKTKSELLYETIDASNGFYVCPVEKTSRSRMNVPFRVRSDAELEAKFVAESTAAGMISLKGHRSVGGIRASLYNAVSLDDTITLVEFMKKFHAENA